LAKLGVGVDGLPKSVRLSKVLTGNDLGMLGNVEKLPADEEIDLVSQLPEVKEILDATIGDSTNRERELHQLAQSFLRKENVELALKIVLL